MEVDNCRGEFRLTMRIQFRRIALLAKVHAVFGFRRQYFDNIIRDESWRCTFSVHCLLPVRGVYTAIMKWKRSIANDVNQGDCKPFFFALVLGMDMDFCIWHLYIYLDTSMMCALLEKRCICTYLKLYAIIIHVTVKKLKNSIYSILLIFRLSFYILISVNNKLSIKNFIEHYTLNQF